MPEQSDRAITDTKGRGRPRVEDPCATVCTWLPSRYHDRLIALAKQEQTSVSATVRQLLILRLK